MIELKFTVDEEFSESDLRDLLYFKHYKYALEEIKEDIFQMLKNDSYNISYGNSIDLDESSIKLLEHLHKRILEICEDLPREY